MYTYESNKISLSAFDDKRYIPPDGINTLACGHKINIPNKIKKKFLIMTDIKFATYLFKILKTSRY